jgi:hypothetical protein
MVLDATRHTVVAEAGGPPQGSPPHQAGEDRATPREGATRRDGGLEPAPEQAGGHGGSERRDETGEGRGQEVHRGTPPPP